MCTDWQGQLHHAMSCSNPPCRYSSNVVYSYIGTHEPSLGVSPPPIERIGTHEPSLSVSRGPNSRGSFRRCRCAAQNVGMTCSSSGVICCSHVGSARSRTGREEVAGGCRNDHVGRTCTREIGDSTWNPSISNIDLRCCTTRSPAAGFAQFFPSTVPAPELGAGVGGVRACWSYVDAAVSICLPQPARMHCMR